MRPRSVFFSLLIYLAFFASGAASLIAEVTWNRMLIVVVGNSMSATAMIIVVFMGGLGLGSFVGGRVFGGRARSLLPYLALEVGIGLYVLLSPALFELLTGMFTSLAETTDARAGLTALRIVVSLAALLLPAFLMGATYPAMIAGSAPAEATKRSARSSYLYSVNTIGAALGAFAAGYHLLFEFGVGTTLKAAFGLYAGAALCALAANALRERGREEEPPAAEAPAAPIATGGIGLRRFLYAATFGIGFASLAYEVLLTRLSILYLGNSISVFALVLTAFLLGTGISAVAGTWLFGVLERRGAGSHRLFGISALVAGVLVMATPYLLLSDRVIETRYFAQLAEAVPRNPLPILGLLILPTVFIGALLPVAIRMLRREGRDEATRGAATLYALNTAGGLIGAGLANHYLVPLIGVQGALLAVSLICVAAGVLSLVALGKPVGRWLLVGLGTAALGAILAFVLPSMMQRYANKLADATGAEKAEVRLVLEGRAATVTVIDQADPRKGTYRDIYLNGVEEASTRFWHTQLFKLLGILPVLAHDGEGAKDVLVIAFGAGITAGSTLASDDVARLDVVDLNPDIEGINDLFTEVNGDVFHSPRFHFHHDDGRNYLVTTNRKYDLIIGDSTHPRAYDSWILYTEEFYEAAKRRLKPGGIFAQWVPVLGSMRGELFRIHLNTVLNSFPKATFWYVYGSDQAFFMATPEPFSLDVAALQPRLDRLAPWFLADHYQIDTVARAAGFFWLDPAAMRMMIAGEERLNTDDRHYFDKQSAVWPLPAQWQLPFFQTSALPFLAGADEALLAAARAEQEVAGHLARFGFYGSRQDLYRAYCLDPENGNARFHLDLLSGGSLPDPTRFCAEVEIEAHRSAAERQPNNPIALNGLADALAAAGRLEEAVGVAERAVGLAPESGMILDTLGWILHGLGRREEALATLTDADRRLPDHPIVLYHLGAARLASGDRREGRRLLERALGLQSDFPGAAEARALLAGGD